MRNFIENIEGHHLMLAEPKYCVNQTPYTANH
jgi:hypothetical protein